MDLNKVQIIGNITQDLELKETPNGRNVVSFSIATNRSWNDSTGNRQEQVEFHNIVLWGKLAEIATEYSGKGKKVYLEGRLQTRNWEAQDGTKRYITEVVGENLIMLDKRGETSGGTNFSTNSTPAVNNVSSKKEEEISIDDIPF